MTLSCLNHVKRSIKGKGVRGPRPPAPPAHTVLEVVYDRSGSMVTIDSNARRGLLTFIKSHKMLAMSSPVKTNFSLTTFDTHATTYYSNVDLVTLPPFTHGQMVNMTRPRDRTRLVDTLYERLVAVNCKVASIVSGMSRQVRNLRPKIVAQILCVTDGLDNASPLYTKAELAALVDRSEAKGIDVIYMGANQDAVETAEGFHIDQGHAMTFGATAATATAAWMAATQNTLFAASGQGGSAPRPCGARATSSAPAFTSLQRANSCPSQPPYATAPNYLDDDDDDDVALTPLRRVPRRPVWAMGNMQGGGGNPRSHSFTSWGAAPPRAPAIPMQGVGLIQGRVPPRNRRRPMNTVQAYNN